MSEESVLDRWRADPAAFFGEMLRIPETGEPFVLFEHEARFVREGFTRREDGRLRFSEWLFSAIKKSRKSTLAAGLTLYTPLVWGGRYAEVYVLANDLEQSISRVFRQAARMIEVSPLKRIAVVTGDEIRLKPTGAVIKALASDFRGAAGGNQVLAVFDELWGYTSEAARRLWDEMVPVPTPPVSARLTVTTAGFEGESELLWQLYQRGLKGAQVAADLYAQDGMLMFWSHTPVVPWQTPEWIEQMRDQLRPNAFLRMIENRFVGGEEAFVPVEWWDACTDSTLRPEITNVSLPVWIGIDASTKRDSTAIAATTWDAEAKKVRLVTHRIFQPSPNDPLDFQGTIVETLRDWRDRFAVRRVYFDPYQMAAVAQQLEREGLPMVEYPQTIPNLTQASTNLYDLVRGKNVAVYADEEIRRAVQRAVAVETSRGWKIAKEKASHRIDVIVALAMAALGAVKDGADPSPEHGEVHVAILGPGYDPPRRRRAGRRVYPAESGPDII